MHHRNVALGLQPALDFKALGSFDILKIDAAEGRRYSLDGLYKAFGVFFIDLDVEAVKSGKNLEQQRLTFHDGLAGLRAYIAQAEHCGAV